MRDVPIIHVYQSQNDSSFCICGRAQDYRGHIMYAQMIDSTLEEAKMSEFPNPLSPGKDLKNSSSSTINIPLTNPGDVDLQKISVERQEWTEGENADLNLPIERKIYIPRYERDQALWRPMQMDGQTLKSGEKKDEGKPRWELLPYDAVEGIVKVLTMGAKKYEARNWERGIAYGRVFGAIQRHLTAWWNGNNLDAESSLSHLDHALTELTFLSAYEKRGMVQFDDRPKKELPF